MQSHLLPIIYALVVCSAQHLLGVDDALHAAGAAIHIHERK